MDYKAKWMEGIGPESAIVVSTRVRVARNLAGVPFPGTMNETQAQEVIATVEAQKGALLDMQVQRMANLSQVDRLALVEKHLISLDLANKPDGAVAISSDQAVAIMVNEEDHLRVQCLLPGLQLEQAWEAASHLSK